MGKSTLMNLLAGYDRSIVTDIPGTTRDIVEETVRLPGGLVLNIADTAGLRTTDDPVEAIGVTRARGKLEQSSLVLAVLDGSAPLSDEDRELVLSLRERPAVAILNKSDLGQSGDEDWVRQQLTHCVTLSAREGTGLRNWTPLCGRLSRWARWTPLPPCLPMSVSGAVCAGPAVPWKKLWMPSAWA